MGGYNSGRYAWCGVVEQRKRLDIRQCARRGWLRMGTSGSYQWTQDGEPCGSVSYTVGGGALELRYTILSGENEGEAVRITIPIRRVPCRYGGERLYWACPNCYRRCEVVVMASHAHFWGCRVCLHLRYSSQGLDSSQRLQRRADAIYARLGDSDDQGLVNKPKWMRWRTFHRLMDHADNLAGKADAAFALRAMRLLKMLG